MTLSFTGDISITGSFVEKVKSNTEIFSEEILTQLKTSDFVIGNLEGPTTEINEAINANTPLKSPLNTINFLHQRNISIFNLANNHILDYGEIGFKKTLDKINDENCSYFGAELTKEKTIKPYVIKGENNISIALFGIAKCIPSKINNSQIFSSDEFSLLKKQVKKYKKEVDFIIVNFHGGEEYTQFPSPVKRKFLKKVAQLENVNCVIAHHSHTFQGYEKHKDTYIFYSLGNFIFDIPNHKIYKYTDKSALLNLHFTKKGFTFNFIPFQINNGKITSYSFDDFNKKINQLSDFSDYSKNWQKEAFRVLFRKEKRKKTDNHKKTLQEKSFFSLFFSKEFYRKVFLILNDKYMFSVYSYAIIYKLKNKF